MSGSVVAPDLTSLPLRIEQTAPGRYVGEFDSEGRRQLPYRHQPRRRPGADPAPGVNVGYSAEYKSGETNLALLRSVAKLPPEGGPPGVLVEEGLTKEGQQHLAEANPFRRDLPPAVANRSIWPTLILIASCALLRRRLHPPRAGGLRMARAALGTRGGGGPPAPPGRARAGDHEPPAEQASKKSAGRSNPAGGRPVSSPPKRAPPPTPSRKPRPKNPANKSPPTSPSRRPKTPPKGSPTPNAS